MEDSVYKPVSFTSHHTYLGLPQLKAYNMIDIYFQLKTSDEDGLILYNGGKGDDFVAVELIRGHIHYTFNMGRVFIKHYMNAFYLSKNNQPTLEQRQLHFFLTIIFIIGRKSLLNKLPIQNTGTAKKRQRHQLLLDMNE